jgi:hypothetical protein
VDELEFETRKRFGGRKAMITSGIIVLTAVLAYYGRMDNDVALVFTGAIASFNYALRNTG